MEIKGEIKMEQMDVTLEILLTLNDPYTDGETLKKYSNSNYTYIRCLVARHSKLPKEVLEDLLYNDKIYYTRIAALDNINVTKEMLKKVSKDLSFYVRLEALNHPNVDEEVLESYKDDIENDVIIKIANHHKVTPELLDYLGRHWLRSHYPDVMVPIITSSKIATSTLERIIEGADNDEESNHLRDLAKQELEKRNHNTLTW